MVSTNAAAPRSDGARQRFRVQFRAVMVVEARDLLDAVRQVESLGTTEITTVSRED